MTSREEFVQTLKRNIDIWNGEIARMEQKIQEASDEGRQEYEQQLEKARELRERARETIEDARNASSEQWDEMRGRMEGAMSDIAQGMRNAWSRFQ